MDEKDGIYIRTLKTCLHKESALVWDNTEESRQAGTTGSLVGKWDY